MPLQPNNPVIRSRLARWLACALLAIGMRDLTANDSPMGQGGNFRPLAQPAAASVGGGPALQTNAAPSAVESDLSPPLRQALGQLASTNVHPPPPDPRKIDPAQEFKMLLDLARRQRAEKTHTPAKRTLQGLLESRASEESKRIVLLELASIAEEEDDLAKAQQYYAAYLKRWPDDLSVPEIYLRQGILYRRMGVHTMALSKLYSVMTSSITLKSGKLDYYQHLVLLAQTEIADTHYLRGEHEEAAELFSRLLKLDASQLNKHQIQFKLIRCLAALGRHDQVIAQAQDLLDRHSSAPEQAELRFILASSLQRSGQKAEALKHILLLLESQQARAQEDRARWVYWQRRAGNEIANQLYEERDYLSALTVYSALASLDASLAWQLPIWYQMGLSYERLSQPQKAAETYERILARQKGLDSPLSPSLITIMDMARWRMEFLNWQATTDRPQTNAQATAVSPLSVMR